MLNAMGLDAVASVAQRVHDKAATMLSEWLHLEEMGFIDVDDEGDDSEECRLVATFEDSGVVPIDAHFFLLTDVINFSLADPMISGNVQKRFTCLQFIQYFFLFFQTEKPP